MDGKVAQEELRKRDEAAAKAASSSTADSNAAETKESASAPAEAPAAPPAAPATEDNDDDEAGVDGNAKAKAKAPKEMSIKELKAALKKAKVSTSGCVEKSDLVAKLEEYHNHK